MIVRRSAILAALAATSDDLTRYYLAGVQLDPAAQTVTATDGHVLFRITDREPIEDSDFPTVPGAEFHGNPAAPFVLPADIARAMLQTMPKKSTLPVLCSLQAGRNGSDKTITVCATDLQAPRSAVVDQSDLRFPDYARVMPAADRPEIGVSIAVELLEAICKAARAVNGTGKSAGKPIVRFGLPLAKRDREDLKIPGRAAVLARAAVDACDESGDADGYTPARKAQPAIEGSPAVEPSTKAGDVTNGIRLTIRGSEGFTIDGVVMPCRSGK